MSESELPLVTIVTPSFNMVKYLAEAIDRFTADIEKLGPLRWPANWAENGERQAALEEIVREHASTLEVPQ